VERAIVTASARSVWIWPIALSAIANTVVLLCVWFLVIVPRIDHPDAELRRTVEREQLLRELREEIDRQSASVVELQKLTYDSGMQRIERVALERMETVAARAVERQLSETFLDDLRARVIDQARQADKLDAEPPLPGPAQDARDQMIREDLQIAQAARLGVAESWLSMGRPPTSNWAAGLRDPETYRSHMLRAMSVGDQGAIVLEFDDAMAGVSSARALLIPRMNAGGNVVFDCVTNVPLVRRVMPLCELRSKLPVAAGTE
jgi:hypothetical protein